MKTVSFCQVAQITETVFSESVAVMCSAYSEPLRLASPACFPLLCLKNTPFLPFLQAVFYLKNHPFSVPNSVTLVVFLRYLILLTFLPYSTMKTFSFYSLFLVSLVYLTKSFVCKFSPCSKFNLKSPLFFLLFRSKRYHSFFYLVNSFKKLTSFPKIFSKKFIIHR